MPSSTNIKQLFNVCLFISFLVYTIADHAEKYEGYELVSRNILVPTGRRIVLFKDIVFRKGRLTHFHGLFGAIADFHFQIWRRVWSPVSQENYMLVSDSQVVSRPMNITLDVIADNIYTEEGDRLGFLNNEIDKAPLLASLSDFVTSTLFNTLTTADTPKVGDTIAFDGLAYPYIFSVGVTYIPDQHDEGIYIGATGGTGSTGPIGRPGDKGELGLLGATGTPGNPGPIGGTGPPGSQGASGYTGATGPQGSTGGTGRMGIKGDLGAQALPGPKGEQGATGAIGSIGSTGATGSTGYTGKNGSPGPKGDLGPKGDIGATGATGGTGPAGTYGATGEPGPLGLQGYTGPQGNPGPVGSPGPPGIFVGILGKCNTTDLNCEQECDSTSGIHKCACKKGFTLKDDERTCHDINECKVNNGGCQMVCVNLHGSYKCQCSDGLKVSPNGHACIDVLECDIDNGDCTGEQTCIELYSSSMCVASDVAYTVLSPNLSGNLIDAGEDDLVTHRVVMGLIIWLVLLTLLIFLVLIIYCIQKRKSKKEKNLYQRYAESARHPYPAY